MERRKLENMRHSPDFRPELMARMKYKAKQGYEHQYHTILMSLVRLGVHFDTIKKIDSCFQNELSTS